MAVKRARKPRNDSATGRQLAMTEAATAYPAWPSNLVDLPSRQRTREHALAWYDHLIRHRTPSAWQAADAARVALLARTLSAWERESWLLQEREGGDAGLADKWHSAIGQLSRQLGLSVAIRDPRLMAGDARARATAQERLSLDDDDDLLARPTPRMN
jgi:hypothetical protein